MAKNTGLGKCRYRNFKSCIGHDCENYLQMTGADPNTGEQLSEWKCSDTWEVLIAMEGNKEIRQLAAAVESMRNMQDQQIKDMTNYLGDIMIEQRNAIVGRLDNNRKILGTAELHPVRTIGEGGVES